jgi:prepilin-type N-terminal cleavage/methylation domain-containing protein
MKKTSGLTLVEIIVAIAVFSIIMLALSGTIVQGLQLRRKNSVDSQALAYATSILETYKNFWSASTNFTSASTPAFPATPPALKPIDPVTDISVTCLNIDGTISATTCALRRVQVTVKDSKGDVYANLVTEIGNPKR